VYWKHDIVLRMPLRTIFCIVLLGFVLLLFDVKGIIHEHLTVVGHCTVPPAHRHAASHLRTTFVGLTERLRHTDTKKVSHLF